MIYFYSGTPGSGKSYHAVYDMAARLRREKKNRVISNIWLDLEGKGMKGEYLYKDWSTISPEFLYEFAYDNHNFGGSPRDVENQTLVVIDECQMIFNSRDFQRKDRMKWIEFFTHHRHLGYTFILISQFDKLVDKQIRCLFEYEIKHRKVNNYKIGKLLPVSTFVYIEYWYGTREKVGTQFSFCLPSVTRLYSSISMSTGGGRVGGTECGCPPAPPVNVRSGDTQKDRGSN